MSGETKPAVHTVVTHERPHLDELAAVWALRRFGGEKYAQIDNAELASFDPAVHLDGRSEKEWLGDGYLFVGVGGGGYDDHPHTKFPEDCAFTIVLKDLGVYDDPALQQITHDVFTEDRHGAPHRLHLASIVKVLHRKLGLRDIVAHVEQALEGLYAAQQSFLDALRIVRGSSSIIHVLNVPSGQNLILVIAEGDNEDVSRAARSREGVGAALVVHRTPPRPDGSGGGTYISAASTIGIRDIAWLAAEVRLAEQYAAGDTRVQNRGRLIADGVLPEIPEWYHHAPAIQVYNRSLTAQNVPLTRLTLKTLEEISVRFLRHAPLRTNRGKQS